MSDEQTLYSSHLLYVGSTSRSEVRAVGNMFVTSDTAPQHTMEV
jgi:hypothetical protein